MTQIVLFVSLYTIIGVLFTKMFIKLGRVSLTDDDSKYIGIAVLILLWPFIIAGILGIFILYLIGKAVYDIVK